MKILIIGCNGFIGSNLLSYFKQKAGATVYGCDIAPNDGDASYFCVSKEENNFEVLNFFTSGLSKATNIKEGKKIPMVETTAPFHPFNW